MLRAFVTLHLNTSLQTFIRQFPLPSLSLWGGKEPIKAVKVLLDQEKIGDVALLLDQIYLQKDVQCQGGKLDGVDPEGNLFKGVMVWSSLKQSHLSLKQYPR